ncbi:MAG: FecR family protein [Elusimicrobia bacterium]|nr:FecR family protein [Elusimicrobiota bacterium]
MALALVVSVAAVRAQTGGDYEARLTAVKGDVLVFTAEEPQGGPGEADMPLQKGDRVKTGANSSAEVAFSGEHGVIVRPNSEFAIASAGRGDAELDLRLGCLLAKIGDLAGGAFRVRTPAAVAAVRGTEFAVEVSPEAQTRVGVFDEGTVEVDASSGEKELLKANQETMVAPGRRPLAAYQLRGFAAQRQTMRGFRKRMSALRASWRSLTPEQRLKARGRMQQRLRELRERRAEMLRGRQQRGRPARLELREDQKRMQRRKDAIRRRLRGGN